MCNIYNTSGVVSNKRTWTVECEKHTDGCARFGPVKYNFLTCCRICASAKHKEIYAWLSETVCCNITRLPMKVHPKKVIIRF